MDDTTSPIKSGTGTGIPRMSRLPTLKPPAFAASTSSTPAKHAPKSFLPSPSKLPPVQPSPVKTSLPKLAGKPSRSSIVGPSSTRLPPPSKPPAYHRPTQSTSSRVPTTFKRPESRSASRLSHFRSRPTSSQNEDDEDQLGALDGFRVASRQGFRDDGPPSPGSSVYSSQEPSSPQARKSSRASLSDRTVESISRLPPTPDRRRSSFFSQSPMAPPSRPASAMSANRRPGSSDSSASSYARPQSPVRRAPMSARPSSRISVDYSAARSTPSRQSMGTALPRASQFGSSIGAGRPASMVMSSSTSGMRPPASTKMPPPRASLANSTAKRPAPATAPKAKPKPNPVHSDHDDDSTLSSGRISQQSSKASAASSALREQIAKAKAAKARANAPSAPSSSHMTQYDGSEDYGFDLSVDPFNARPKGDNKGLLRKRIDAARADGRLNIAAMGLKEIPEEVLTMYDADQMVSSSITWNETVDLVRFNAADNEIEAIGDGVFPDIDRETAAMDDSDEAPGLQFGGLEMLDLHGNSLSILPMGVRRLDILTSLNLSHNKFQNSIFDIVSQIESLKELKLGHNNIAGYLPASFNSMKKLRSLDLQSNRLLSLPEGLRELRSLQVLNVSSNQLTGIPMDALEALPLTDLLVAHNAMVGALFPFSVSGLSSLRYLDVSNNSLASLAFSETLSLPALRTLNIASNRIVALPDVSSWGELISLAAEDNKISAIPEGFTTLKKIRQADFTSNDITQLHEDIALMDSLESVKFAANPLRQRRLLNMETDDLKRELRSRLRGADEHRATDAEPDFEDEGIDIHSPQDAAQQWKPSGGVLDLRERGLVDEDADSLRSILGANDIRELKLAKNNLTTIPFELSLAQQLRVLDLSNCSLGQEYLTEVISLQALHELHLPGNKLSSWEPLMAFFHAPSLKFLDVSNNRLVGSLPALQSTFPALKSLYVRDNKIDAVSAEALVGLHTADLSGNNIGYLPPEIGLLWAEGLRGFNVGGNVFRVPSHHILDKGTEATLAWLRKKLPAAIDAAADDEMF